jgi:FkbM family methyltransferase
MRMDWSTGARQVWRRVPEGVGKDVVRAITRAILPRWYPVSFVEELRKLDITQAGLTEDGLPFLSLADGVTLCGCDPLRDGSAAYYRTDRQAYRWLPTEIRRRIPPECIRLALDVILRYCYPHATPDRRPPYSAEERRRHWLGQHADTIDDLQGLNDVARSALKARFALHSGGVVVDVGACYGFGAVRYSRLVGPAGRVVAVEADPSVQRILRRNVETNAPTNVEIVPCGVWNTPSELALHVGSADRQHNSLRGGVFPSRATVLIPTDTIDNIVGRLRLGRVDLVSITINAAELEAVQGMDHTLRRFAPNLSVAGWYRRDGHRVHELVSEHLRRYAGYRVAVGPMGRVLAWNTS